MIRDSIELISNKIELVNNFIPEEINKAKEEIIKDVYKLLEDPFVDNYLLKKGIILKDVRYTYDTVTIVFLIKGSLVAYFLYELLSSGDILGLDFERLQTLNEILK